MTTEVLPNGVNARAVVAYAQQLQSKAPLDGTPFRADVRWRGGFRNEILVRDLPPTYADEPEILGERGVGQRQGHAVSPSTTCGSR